MPLDMNSPLEYPLEKLQRLNLEKIKEIHGVSIRCGKTQNEGVRDEGTLVHIATEIRKMAEKQKEGLSIAAMAIEKITKNHPFWDGNH